MGGEDAQATPSPSPPTGQAVATKAAADLTPWTFTIDEAYAYGERACEDIRDPHYDGFGGFYTALTTKAAEATDMLRAAEGYAAADAATAAGLVGAAWLPGGRRGAELLGDDGEMGRSPTGHKLLREDPEVLSLERKT